MSKKEYSFHEDLPSLLEDMLKKPLKLHSGPKTLGHKIMNQKGSRDSVWKKNSEIQRFTLRHRFEILSRSLAVCQDIETQLTSSEDPE